ncbi:MAG TPA: nitrophenyl compound nitroreductase subunit ArsF family protein [candidate division Zixibacteria bacterium]|nr:nitrophenyl compound nitroreductase subunit ArsF family protein [candidate division Zixibacteria bacterium]
MTGKKIITYVLLLFVVVSAVYLISQETSSKDEAKSTPPVSTAASPAERVVAYYFHGNARCQTCLKLEAYAQEAIASGFQDKLDAGLIDWRVVNTDLNENEHFVKDYGLTLQTVVLSREKDGKQVEWKSLDKIWDLVGDKQAYTDYIQTELRDYLNEI